MVILWPCSFLLIRSEMVTFFRSIVTSPPVRVVYRFSQSPD
jgi:hypothetical protein